MQIPIELRAALNASLEGIARGPLAERAEYNSALYRDGINRAPAAYGAVRNVLSRLRQRNPDFAPHSALDLGSGAGAASWAIAETFPQIATITQADPSQPLLTLSRSLAQHASSVALRNATQLTTDLNRNLPDNSADLVVLSHVLSELPYEQAQSLFVAAWALCSGALILVEPGTPAGFGQILAARFILGGGGAHILAPCAHQRGCPILSPDWCHFAQRIERPRSHRFLKSADLPYEGEEFSYIIFVREPYFMPATEPRILARPQKARTSITLKLCQPDSSANLVTISRRDKQSYTHAKKMEWGDEF
ncbi:small ribosomal subunit Rsm22 family protein [Terracidiphilus gabretensis]|uniref:small ribosomal subunit Rsm22 family protein n=1 Tax=Terracidiphilus gabretensis TaxID=1577687 RepID=UPI00071BACEF|nr:small ribosomal subunit Rsm22 family protein [Terracidiphilus gabretensis]